MLDTFVCCDGHSSIAGDILLCKMLFHETSGVSDILNKCLKGHLHIQNCLHALQAVS